MVYYTKSNIIPVVHLYKKQFVIIGASAPNPDLLFVLTLKRQAKKVRTAPASLEKKLAFNWLKPFKLRSFIAQTGQLFPPISLFFSYADRWFGSPDEITR